MALVAVAIGLLAAPAFAGADATVVFATGQMTIADDSTSEVVGVATASGQTTVAITHGVISNAAPAGCAKAPDSKSISCAAANRILVALEGGDDTFRGLPGSIDVSGGPGTDTLDLSTATVGMDVFLNDFDDDGDVGQGANVRSDVENLLGSPHFDRFSGTAGPNDLRGGDGPDSISGEGGADTLLGEGGDDTLNARDGVADTVDCGAGTDEADIDPIDVVTGCERLPGAAENDTDGDGLPDGADQCPTQPAASSSTGCPAGGGGGGAGSEDACDQARAKLAKAKDRLKKAKAKLKDANGDSAVEKAKKKVARAKQKVRYAKELVAAAC